MLPIPADAKMYFLNSLSPSFNASKCIYKLCYGKISFVVLVPDVTAKIMKIT